MHFQYVEKQARGWALKRLLTLHTIWKTDFMDVMQSGRQLNDTQITVKIDHRSMMVINKILDLFVEADLAIRVRTDGFHMPHGIDRRLVGAVSGEKSSVQLNKIYSKMEKRRIAGQRVLLRMVIRKGEAEFRRSNPAPSFMRPVSQMTSREFAHKKCQPEFENPPPLKAESWVKDVNSDSALRFGFVIYRISYTEPNDKWIEFLAKLEKGLNSSWDGMVDAEFAQKKATLEWIDGSAYNIAEGDLNGVRE